MQKIFLLTLLMLFAELPSLARDFEYTYEGKTLTYTVIDEDAKTCEVTKNQEVSGEIILPKHPMNGQVEYTLISIGESAFENCNGLTSIEIPNSVITIGDYAFSGCSGLNSVDIPNSLTSIGLGAFSSCDGLTKAEFASIESLCNINFGNGYNPNQSSPNPLHYAHHLYINGEEVTNLVIPESVTSIGNFAFDGCSNLTSVDIPNSVTSIGLGAFMGCSGLDSVVIPNSVTSIRECAFRDCSGLTKAEFASIESICNINFGNGDDPARPNSNPLSYAHHLYISGEEVTNLVIPESVLSIGNYAFDGCSNLTSVDIPKSVTSIGLGAFMGCSGLDSVDIPNSVTSIGWGAFYGCSGLTSVVIPNSVSSIGLGAFYGCSGLTSVVIPNSVTSIGDGAFYGCSGLTSVVIPNSVTSIGNTLFYDCTGLTSVVISKAATSIGYKSFGNCKNIQTIYSANEVPPTCWSNTFDEVPTDAVVHVPVGSIPSYSTSKGWKRFFNFVETDDFPNAVESISVDAGSGSKNIFNMNGVCLKRNATQADVDALAPGLYIIAGKKVIIK